MTNVLDPGGMFPAQDGITTVTASDVPPGFDLTQLLSETMRSRPAWLDLAKATSRQMYKYFEQTRIALELSRDPQHLGRVLKIATLRMMGMDWNSDSLTDDDYDRMLNSISLYNMGHGPNDFVNYMGYSLGIPLDLIPLWSQDYKEFLPGPREPTIFDSPPQTQGAWYPTTHVGILYQEFAANASDADTAVLTDIFYRVAPINLVLEWVGSEVTLSVGNLLTSINFYEHSEDTIDIEYEPMVTLNYDSRMYEETFDTAILTPYNPERDVWHGIGADSIDVGTDFTVCPAPCLVWGPDAGTIAPLSLLGGYAVPGYSAGNVVLVDEPAYTWTDGSGVWTGMLLQASATLLVSASGNPTYSTWFLNHVSVAQTFVRYDGQPGYSVASTALNGNVSTAVLSTGTDLVMLTMRPAAGTTSIVIKRGTDVVTFTVAGSSAVSNGCRCGAYPIGSGFYTVWGQMTGDKISVLPGGTSAVGGFDWLDFQVAQGRAYPLPMGSTQPAPGSTPVWTFIFIDDYGIDYNSDFGAQTHLGHDDYNVDYDNDFGSISGIYWYFFNGMTEDSSSASLPNGAELSSPTVLTGSTCTFPNNQLRNPYGVMVVDMVALWSEWVLGGPQTLLDMRDSAGVGLNVTVDASNTIITLSDGAVDVAAIPLPTNPIKFGLAWSPTGSIFYLAGQAYPLSGTISSNTTVSSLGKPINGVPDSTLVLQRIFIMGSTTNATLPTNSYMRGVTI